MVSLQIAVLALAVSGGKTELLDFRADWCGPCRQMDPVVERLSAQGYPVRRVDVDRNRALAERYRIGNIPCFVLLVDGREVDRSVGINSAGQLQQMFRRASAAQAGPEVLQARGQSPDRDAAPRALPVSQGRSPLATVATTAPSSSESPISRLLSASVRLKVEDAKGHSVGSGTVIDARESEALVLTCAHIFRDSQGKGPVSVDFFGPDAPTGLSGRVLAYDLKSDVGLVAVKISRPVAFAQVAPAGYGIRKNDPVTSIGCNNGGEPTARQSRVTAIDKFLGPPNLQVAGQPVQGRSGGGLFAPDGLVIGVCNAADPQDNEGLFAALASIHAMLDREKLSGVYRRAEGTRSRESAVALADPPTMPEAMPAAPAGRLVSVPARADAASSSPLTDTSARLSSEERATLNEIQEKSPGAEVICVIRSLDNPQAKSEIIVLDKASPAFLSQLAGERRTQDSRHLTSLAVPRRSGATGIEPSRPAENASDSPKESMLRWVSPAK
ncbi:MAG: trypsin-like peptidase domain-containing protein [Pirellulales bacterium]